ncbi:putative TRF2-interacting telomeric protein/Rap1 [Septoria linicola]|nr:putative TRF2-interacting telomeric protein/Rap1 [Septoria linicola]
MAGAPLVVSDATHRAESLGKKEHGAAASVFAGLSFFLVQRLPTRSQLIRDIETNGGRVVKLETQADYVIADHARTDAPAGSYSWKLITTAIRDGAVPTNLADFPAGPRPGTVRDVGSGMPAKGTRTAFTLDEDRELWQWVEHEKARGAMIKGNEIYKRLEQVNPRHTFQAWRDRYIKKLINDPPAGVGRVVPTALPRTQSPAEVDQDLAEDFPTPPAKRSRVQAADDDQDHAEPEIDREAEGTDNGVEEGSYEVDEVAREDEMELRAEEELNPDDEGSDGLDQADIDRLLVQAPEIENVDEGRREEAWQAWSQAYPHRDPDQWAAFWLERVQPLYRMQCDAQQVQDQLKGEAPSDEPATLKRKRFFDTESIGSGRDDLDEPRESTSAPNGHQHVLESSTVHPASQSKHQQPVAMQELPTSDANQAANQQIMGEVLGAFDASTGPEWAGNSLKRAYDVQHEDKHSPQTRQRTDVRKVADVSRVRSRDSSVSDADEQERVPSIQSWNTEDEYEQQLTGSGHVTALTAANLAHQEAQSKEPLRRGADLEEDDPNKDQSDFVRFLQAASGGKTAIEYAALPTYNHIQSLQEEARVGDHSSEADVDDILRTNLEWPSSPQRPAGPTSNGRFVAGRAIGTLSKQPTGTGQGPFERHADQTGGESAAHPERDHDAESEHDIDLTVAFPDVGGGFDPSSDHFDSQIRTIHSPEPERYPATTNQTRTHDHETTPTAGDIIEISSASPPSSSIESGSQTGPDGPDHQDSTVPVRTRRVLETQDIFGAETQGPDLSMPLPPDSDDEFEHENIDIGPELGQRSRSTTHESTPAVDDMKLPVDNMASEDDAMVLDSWISTMEVRGYEEHLIIQALKCTSMRLDLAELVLVHIKSGKGIPDDVPGVWDDEEDDQLEGGNARAIRLLEAKHGWDACKARLEYLEEYRGAE